MRWTGWILAIAVGWASVADGQSCCRRSGGCLTGYSGPLSGEACCSPPGFSVSAWPGPCCCYADPLPLLRQRLGRLLRTSCEGSGILGAGRCAEELWLLLPLRSVENAGDGLRSLFRLSVAGRTADDCAGGRGSCSRRTVWAFASRRPAVQPRRQCRPRRSPVPPRPPRGRCLRLHRFPTRRAKCPIRPPRPPRFRHHNR